MRTMLRLALVVAAGGWLLLAGEARADRASCDQLLAARTAGQSDTQIASTYRVTHARIVACERITEHHLRLERQQADYEDARAARFAARRGY